MEEKKGVLSGSDAFRSGQNKSGNDRTGAKMKAIKADPDVTAGDSVHQSLNVITRLSPR